MKLYVALFGLLLVCACEQDQDIILDETTTKPLTKILVTGSMSGLIHDERGQALEEIPYELDQTNRLSNQSGFYHAMFTDVNQRGTAIKLSYNDKEQTRTLMPIENVLTLKNIGIFTSPTITESSSGDNYTENLSPSLKLSVQADSYEFTALLSDPVIKWSNYALDIDNHYHRNCLSGPPVAVGQNGDHQFLHIETAFTISSTANDAEILNWTGEINFSSADNTLSLFKFNPTDLNYYFLANPTSNNGILNYSINGNGEYVIASTDALTLLKGKIRSETGQNISADLALITDGNKTPIYSSTSGNFLTYAPALINTEIMSLDACNEEITSESFLLPEEPIHYRDVQLPSEELTTINAIPVDCDFNPLEKGIAVISQDGIRSYHVIADDQIITPLCRSSEFEIFTIDPVLSMKSTLLKFPSSSTINTAKHPICADAQEEYFYMHLDGEDFIYYDNVHTEIENDRTKISLLETDGSPLNLNIWFKNRDIGPRLDTELNIEFEDRRTSAQYSLNCPTSNQGCGFKNFLVTHYEETNGWIRVYFEGDFFLRTRDPSLALTRKTTGQFQVRRTF